MFKKILTILFSLLLIPTCFSIVSCGKKNNNSKKGDNNSVETINLDYMKNMIINLDGEVAFCIKKDVVNNNDNNVANVSYGNNEASYQNTEDLEKYFLYSTSDSTDESKSRKVTFNKNKDIKDKIYDDNGNEIKDDTIIHQDDMNAQINKLYIGNKFIFIQFISIVEDSGTYKYEENDVIKEEYVNVRPEKSTYDNEGISEFDKSDYYSSALVKSFVIDKTSGFIYEIRDIKIKEIKDDLVKLDDNYIYSLYINENNELEIKSLFSNSTIEVLDFFSDRYGNNYIKNKTVDFVDNQTNTIYYTDTNSYVINDYVKSQEGSVIHINIDAGTGYFGQQETYSIKLIGDNLTTLEIQDEDKFDFNDKMIAYDKVSAYWIKVSHIENNILYLYSSVLPSRVAFVHYDIKNNIENSYHFTGNYLMPLNYETIIIFSGEPNSTGKLSYYIFDYESETEVPSQHIYKEYKMINAKILLNNCIWIGNYYNWTGNGEYVGDLDAFNKFSVNTINETLQYLVVFEIKKSTTEVSTKLISEYKAEQQKSYVYQPLD